MLSSTSTLKSTAIQTEFEDAAMSTRVSAKSPTPTQANYNHQANATKKVFLPTDESTKKTSIINAEELKVNQYTPAPPSQRSVGNMSK